MNYAFINLKLQNDAGTLKIKPSEIVSFSAAPKMGTRVVTRQKQIYYVHESLVEVDQIILEFFEKIKREQ